MTSRDGCHGTFAAVLLDVLLPQRCAACELPGAALRGLPRLADPALAAALRSLRLPGSMARAALCRVQRAADRVRDARAAILYDAPARRFVHAWKERGQRRLAREAAALVAETLARPDVALSPSSRPTASGRRRGHRPAEALARELGRALGAAGASRSSGGRGRCSASEGSG